MRVRLPAIALAATALAAAPSGASADVRLSTERSVTRWTHANLVSKVRMQPTRRARSIGRLRWQTEDDPPEVYVVLSSRRVRGATWMELRIPGRPSHGCVRVPNAAIVRLARLMPIGTPVRIR